MNTAQCAGYVRNSSETLSRGCPHCEWHTVVDSYPEMVKRYQDHLREDHPKAWLRG